MLPTLPKYTKPLDTGVIRSAEEKENFYNSQLAAKLRDRGFETAGFERIFKIRRGDGKKPKPDISFVNGGVHLVSAKFGERLEKKAYTTADEYKEDLRPVIERYGQKLGEVFAVSYPAGPREKFHLHILPKPGRKEIPLVLDSLDEVAAKIKVAVDGLLNELADREEPVIEEAERLFRWGALDLAECLRGVETGELESIFGGHDFFHSVLQARLEGEKRLEALRIGAAYLFVNQVLFYALLSQAAERAGQPNLYPRIQIQHFGSPESLRDQYFQRVHAKNYEPIYGFDVAQKFWGLGTEEACKDLVSGVLGLVPKLDVPDLVGRVFQRLIPLDLRKPLGAHYTNPKAAKLLATLAIDRPETKILDPACGSGTLLVESYQRKMRLSGYAEKKNIHRTFVEQHITGIDAMAFAAHLAAVNLALQEPLLDTDHVRIAMADSTGLKPGSELVPTEKSLRPGLYQGSIQRSVEARKKQDVGMKGLEGRSIRLHKVDLVIMNPPFTSRGNMAKEYRDAVDGKFSDLRYRKAISGKNVSLQAYFLLLADRFLERTGRIAAVLPLNTFVGYDYWPLIYFLLHEYTIEYLIVGLGRCAFSEDTSLSECLFVARKEPPDRAASFKLVGTLKPPEEWESDLPSLIADAAKAGQQLSGLALVKEFPQTALAPSGRLLSDLALRLIPEYDKARTVLDEVVSQSRLQLVTFKEWRNEGVRYQDRIEPVRHLKALGASALLALRDESRALKQIDRMIFYSETGGLVTFRDRVGGAEYRFPVSNVQPCVRRLSYLEHLDITGETDYCVKDPGAALERPMESMYGVKESKRMLAKLRSGGFWKKCCEENSSRVIVARRVDLAAPGTTLICCRSDKPVFNGTSCAAKHFKDPTQEKLFCLWMNSSFGLLQLVASTPTRGSWVGIQRNIVDKVILPNYDDLSEQTKEKIESLWVKLSRKTFKSILNQMEERDDFRYDLDDGILDILGIADSNRRTELALQVRQGVAAAIKALRKTMGSGQYSGKNDQAAEPEEDEYMGAGPVTIA